MTSLRQHFLRQPLRQSDGKEDVGDAFSDPIFDEDYYGRDQAGGRGRAIGLVVGVVAGTIIAGAAAWTVFGPGSGLEGGRTPLIVAEPEPYKVKPKDPGGMKPPNLDILVYGRVGGSAAEPVPVNILPSPPAPRRPVQVATPPVVSGVVEETIKKVIDVAKEVKIPVQATSETVLEPSVVSAAPTAPEPQKSLESMVAVLSGDYLIQIAALRSEEAVEGEWARIIKLHPNLLGMYTSKIVRADLGARGTFFRLRAGPLKDRTAAEKLCVSLAAQNVGCLVVRND
ncbi:MAG: SPOR domain-containing protein [Rhodospirillaceae bacterium]|nr:SPOR domain-containing protein [Rhodospirillaceae bacterium]